MEAWYRHNAPRLGASLAFNTILSLAPLSIAVIAAAGAALTSLLFSLGKIVIGLYLFKTGLGSTYGGRRLAGGSAGVGVYYSAQVFLLGAEFTRVFARCYGCGPSSRFG